MSPVQVIRVKMTVNAMRQLTRSPASVLPELQENDVVIEVSNHVVVSFRCRRNFRVDQKSELLRLTACNFININHGPHLQRIL